jgi:cytochrome c biogenesis protein CcmG, thiol:disulfide interchange protein DsbE
VYGAAAIFALVLVLAAWLSRGVITVIQPGGEAPEFTVTDLEGQTVRLSDFRGKVVLLNIWATWCLPCREEMPSMERLYQELREEDFEILAVSIDKEPGVADTAGNVGGDVAEFVKEYALTFRILLNPRGDIQTLYQTTGVPESFIIDKNGIIQRRLAGPAEWDDEGYLDLIRRLIDAE